MSRESGAVRVDLSAIGIGIGKEHDLIFGGDLVCARVCVCVCVCVGVLNFPLRKRHVFL